MAARLCILMLVFSPAALWAVDFGLPTRKPVRNLFASSAEPGEPFGEFALGSVLHVYPYHDYSEARTSGEFRDFFPFLWLDWRASAVYAQRRFGLMADLRFQEFMFVELGGMARRWEAQSAADRLQIYGAWIGGNLPFPQGKTSLSVSMGFGAAYFKRGKEEPTVGFMVTSRLLAFPLWPLSFTLDTTYLEIGRRRTVDYGLGVGAMVFRHLFAEIGYRGTWSPGSDYFVHGVTVGLAFYWRISHAFDAFAAPGRLNTW